jgi:hypothetical protein
MPTPANEILRQTSTRFSKRSQGASWPLIVAALLALYYLATSVYISTQRLFWFDELFTIHIARIPKLSTMWSALGSGGLDALPPTYYTLVRFFDAAFGPAEWAARLPSALALVIGLLLIFDCARRLTDGFHGLIAFGVATSSFLLYYGYEARSYALYFMLAALAFWLWNHDGLSTRTKAVLFGAVFFLGGCFHYYFMMCLPPFVVWELLRWKKGKRLPLVLLSGIVGCALSLLLFSPYILAFSHKFGGGYWNRPSLKELLAMFMQVFPDGMFLLAVIALWIALVRADSSKQEDTAVPAMRDAEIIGWLFLGVPLAAYVIAVLKTNAFFSRYFIGMLPGIAVAFAMLVWRQFGRDRRISVGLLLLLLGWGVAQQASVVTHIEKVEPGGIRDLLGIESQLHVEGKKYLVFSAPMLYLDSQQYSAHPDDSALLLPPNFANKPADGPDPFQHQRLEVNLSQYCPLQFWTFSDLRRHADQVALVDPDELILSEIQHAGIHVTGRMMEPRKVYYLQ